MMDEIDHYFLLSLGFSSARITDPEKTLHQLRSVSREIQVQLLKAGLVAGPEHLRFAARNALHSFKGKSPKSKSLAVEYLLFISCQRQILKAINFLGVEPSDNQVVLVALSESKEALHELEKASKSLLGDSQDALIEIGSGRKLIELQHSYGVSRTEMEAARFQGETDDQVLKRLIVERSALLSIQD
jgi:tRNA threonylcarbamoyladenosine modification (KEOPS) complex Cgi121 subunit